MFEHQDCASVGKASLVWLSALAVVGMLAFSVSACNTMSGMGEDVEAAGSAMHGTAEDTKDDMKN